METDFVKIISEYNRILSLIFYEVMEQDYLQKNPRLQLSKTQFTILKILRTSGSFKGSELAEILDISRAAVSKNIDKLVKLNLVNRKIIETDRRTMQISIRKSGEKFIDAYEDLRYQKQSKALSSFNKNEKKQLAHLLHKYVQQCLKQQDTLDLICLQCNDSMKERCIVQEHINRCRFYHRAGN